MLGRDGQRRRERRERDDGSLLGLLALLGFGVAVGLSPSASGSVSYRGGDETKVTPPPTPPPAPAGPPPKMPPLVGPLAPWPRDVTPRGYWHAPRYELLGKSFGRKPTAFSQVDHLHQGADYAGKDGSSVYAVEGGTLEAADAGRFGEPGAVALRSDDGRRRWVYVHVRPVGKLPRHVDAGATVATIGGNHLHISVTVDGEGIDPAPALASAKRT